MQYLIPFQLRNKENRIIVEYNKIENVKDSGFEVLNVPFDVNQCIGYPMIHAYFDNLNLKGYERYCGWIQIIRKEEYNTVNQKENVTTTYEIDFCAQTKPYFCIGFPAELFDAPCKNLGTNEKLIWTAYTYLVDPPSRMNDNQMTFLAGFSWGYTESVNGAENILDFNILGENDWKMHRELICKLN